MTLSEVSGPALTRSVLLSQFTTLRIGGPADFFAVPKSEEELIALLAWARREGFPFFVLGHGSNVVFQDAGFRGLVISLRDFRHDWFEWNSADSTLKVSAGLSLKKFVGMCEDHGASGAEFLAQIPGTIGGALVMNAGFSRHQGQTNEIADILLELRCLDEEGRPVTLRRPEIRFGYRSSDLEGKILLDATFQLWKRPKDRIRFEMDANRSYRVSAQAVSQPNAGSVFKNPPAPALPAGILIERAGMKGVRVNGIAVSEIHANYFINLGDGTCADFLALLEKVRKAVFDATGIHLEPEVRVIPQP